MTKPILIIGRPHAGKTTFLAQLYARLGLEKSELKLYKPVDNLTPILDALNNLANGEEVVTTPTDRSTKIIFPIQFNDQRFDLICPDYGGEQINQIVEYREVERQSKSGTLPIFFLLSLSHPKNFSWYVTPTFYPHLRLENLVLPRESDPPETGEFIHSIWVISSPLRSPAVGAVDLYLRDLITHGLGCLP